MTRGCLPPRRLRVGSLTLHPSLLAHHQTPSYEFLDEQEPPLLPSTASAEHVAPSRTPRPAAAVAPSPSNKKSGKATSMSDIVLKESIKVLAKNILKLQELFRQ